MIIMAGLPAGAGCVCLWMPDRIACRANVAERGASAIVNGIRLCLLSVAAATCLAGRPVLAEPAADEVVAGHIAALGATLDERAAIALGRIDGTGRRLLALRAYLRGNRTLAERWSWTEEQIHAYEGSAEQRDLQLEIERVRAEFVAANPGYEIWVNPQIRSLDVQLEHWNSNASIGQAGSELLDALRVFLATPDYSRLIGPKAQSAVEQFLLAHQPTPVPPLAAPGLSPHGQMRAVDFQVHQGDRIVAGPNTESIATDWDAGGWAQRLDSAVRAASQRFVGPLQHPREPWHYTFTPERVGAN
jgi:hypothetical protein